jgi:hypothetical protein
MRKVELNGKISGPRFLLALPCITFIIIYAIGWFGLLYLRPDVADKDWLFRYLPIPALLGSFMVLISIVSNRKARGGES